MEGQFDRNELDKLYQRDPGAIERWFHCYVDVVFTFVYYKVGKDSELAEDIVQDTFLEGISKISRYDLKRASMSTWLTLLSRNHIKKALRSRKQMPANPGVIGLDFKSLVHCRKLTSQVMPDEIAQSREMAELVQATLADIPENHGQILKLRYYSGKSISQIAAFCQMSEGAVKVLLHRARKSFEKAFIRLAGDASNACRKEGGQDG